MGLIVVGGGNDNGYEGGGVRNIGEGNEGGEWGRRDGLNDVEMNRKGGVV